MICAIDPGHQNCAYAIVDPNTREVVACGVHRVSTPHVTPDHEVAQNCTQLMIELCAQHNIEQLYVEYQGMGRAMTVVETAFLAAGMCCGVDIVRVIYPLHIKKAYAALGCRGNRQNKKDAEALVVEMGYANYVSHVADCVLMANYALDYPSAKI